MTNNPIKKPAEESKTGAVSNTIADDTTNI